MLEPIREYALERLDASSDAEATWNVTPARTSRWRRSWHRSSPATGKRVTLDHLEREHANLRAAIDWADARGDAEVALGITIAVWRLWQKRGYLREARTLVTTLIGRPWSPPAPALRARAHE
jgi:predicted ATPase